MLKSYKNGFQFNNDQNIDYAGISKIEVTFQPVIRIHTFDREIYEVFIQDSLSKSFKRIYKFFQRFEDWRKKQEKKLKK